MATVICGDNYFAENIEAATRGGEGPDAPYRPELLLAGPAFNAGRYGIACGAVCKDGPDQSFESRPSRGCTKKTRVSISTERTCTSSRPKICPVHGRRGQEDDVAWRKTPRGGHDRETC